ncbi:cohesin complex subunit [Tilletia horrida]|nr:cohesin complex subunit [Tilletia horrida]
MRRDTTAAAAAALAAGSVDADNIATRRSKRKAAEVAAAELNETGKKSRPTSGSSSRTSSNASSVQTAAAKSRGRKPARATTASSDIEEDNDEDDQNESEEEAPARRTSSRKTASSARAVSKPAPKKGTTQRDASSDKEGGDDDFSDSSEDTENDNDADEDFGKQKSGRKPRTSNISAKGGAAAAKTAKKARVGAPKKNGTAAAPSRAQPSGKGRGRGAAGGAGRQGSGAKVAGRNKEELPIKDDNFIFNAVKDPETALDTAAEDWVAMYHDAPAEALAQLVTFLLRSAASNSQVEEDAVTELDEVVDKVEELQNAAKKESMPSYPIVSKSADFKRFRQSLAELWTQLLASAHESEALFDDTFVDTLKSWVIAMSGSSLRAFRHTATLHALFLISSLNDVLVQVRSALSAAIRQRDAEKKKGRSDKARLRDMEKKVQEQKDFEAIIKSHKEDLFTSVFVHRYRDADLSIRCDCVSELGLWMKKHAEQYMSGTYFTYLGWVLSDAEPPVRLAAIQAMGGLYAKGSLPGPLRHFTDRFKGRLVDMAVGETDVGVRCATFSVLAAIDRHVSEDEDEDAILDDSQKDVLGVQLFDVEAKVRKACAPFVSTILGGLVEAGRVELTGELDEAGEDDAEERQEKLDASLAKLRFKAVGELLVNYGKVLDERLANANEDWSAFNEDEALKQVAPACDSTRQGRVGLAIKSLWEVNTDLHDIKPLVELLSLDHSYNADGAAAGGSAGADSLPPAPALLKLAAGEETVLVEVLVTLLRRIRENADSAIDQSEEHLVETTRILIEAIPRFFAKYKTDSVRITEILLVPQIIKLDEYLELNGMTAFAALWDDIIDQFVRHVEPALLDNAMNSMRALNAAKGFGETNASKLSGLQEQLLASLRSAAQDLDVEQDNLTERKVHAFSVCMLRLRVLATAFDNVQVMEADDAGKLSTGWELSLALASRGRVGTDRAHEAAMVQDALTALCWYLAWKAHQLRAAVVSGAMQQSVLEAYTEKRKVVVRLMGELVGAPASAGVAASVQRVAFEQLVRLHILFVPRTLPEAVDEDGVAKAQLASALQLSCSSDLQKRCAKFVESEIWRFSFSLSQEKDAHKTKHTSKKDSASDRAGDDSSMIDVRSSDVEDDEDGENGALKKSQANKAEEAIPPFHPSKALLKRELEFGTVVAALISGLRLGVFDVKHAGMLLKHYGRLGPVFDSCIKILVDVLREAALKFGFATDVCNMALRAMEESFDFYLAEGKKGSDANFLALCRAVSSIIVLRGRNLSILRAVSSSSLIQLHVGGIRYTVQKAKEGADEDIEVTTKRAPGFFRGLLHLLASMQARDALKIKTEMDKLIREAQLDTAFKAWDPQRTYEKRLVGIVAKNQEAKTAGSGHPASAQKQPKAAAGAADAAAAPSSEAGGLETSSNAGRDADADGEDDHDMQDVDASLAASASASASASAAAAGSGKERPRPRQFSRGAKRSAAHLDSSDLDDDDQLDGSPSTRRRSSASAFGTGAGPLSILADDDFFDLGASGSASRHHGRAAAAGGDDDEEEAEDEEEEEEEDGSSSADKENAGPPSSQTTISLDQIPSRKRPRRT